MRITGRRSATWLALAGAVLASPVLAGDWELSLYGGGQSAPHSTVRTSDLGDDVVGWKGRSLAMPPYYGLRATWWKSERTGFGLEMNHAKVYADDPAAYGYDRLEFTDGLNLVTANVWTRFDPLGPLTPYAGLGAGLAVPHVDITPAGLVHTFGYQVTGPAFQWVAGVSYPLGESWSVFGEYKGSYSTHKVDLDSGGWLKTNIVTNALNLGLSVKF